MPCLTPLLIGLSLHTHHFGSPEGITDSTPGAYVQTECGLTLGTYRNSEGHPSLLTGYTHHFPGTQWSLLTGTATGYRSRPLTPVLLPSYATPLPLTNSPSLRVTPIPKAGKIAQHGGVHFSIEWSFKP